jgi:hypothetical protein
VALPAWTLPASSSEICLKKPRELRSSDPDYVLVAKSGRPWVDRKTRTTDSVRTEFDKLNARLPFKHLRKTSATALGSHPEFRTYAQYFLGHAPETVADLAVDACIAENAQVVGPRSRPRDEVGATLGG